MKLIFMLALLVVVQTAEQRPQFEVASVKPNVSGPGPVQIHTGAGSRFTATNVTLQSLVQFAYRVQAFQVIGGPDWINTDRFDIVAKGDGAMQLMLQAMLADRFKLVSRAESRDLPIYNLVVARSDGRLGPSLHASTVGCDDDRGNINKAPLPSAGAAPCGIRGGIGTMTLNGAPMAQFANTLSGLLERTVVDRTALTGNFEGSLKWTPDESTPGLQKKAAFVAAVDPNGPSIFTALQEQLGLKLDAAKGPVDVLIVVSAQRPVAN